MSFDSLWIVGAARTGKTTCLVKHFRQWHSTASSAPAFDPEGTTGEQSGPATLVFAATESLQLADRLAAATPKPYPLHANTPLRFFRDEVILFWPLLIQKLNLRAQFPLRLRPETEQELATTLWRPELDRGLLSGQGLSEARWVRRVLDLLQLASASGTPVEDIPKILNSGLSNGDSNVATNLLAGAGEPLRQYAGELLLRWQQWCLERGLLTYGIVCELYWRHLLPDPQYQHYLTRRYGAVLGDDTDEYPAITRALFEFLLDQGLPGIFTHNPDGAVRLGLDADPNYLAGLQARCHVEILDRRRPLESLRETVAPIAWEMVNEGTRFYQLPVTVQVVQTTSRAKLLRNTAEIIIQSVRAGDVQPQDIAVITPGLDAIARYTLTAILNSQGIPVEPLNEQRPLSSSPVIRALLTLLALVYHGLGYWVDRDAVAEMLVVLSRQPTQNLAETELLVPPREPLSETELTGPVARETSAPEVPTPSISVLPFSEMLPFPQTQTSAIDPVRAGLLVDHCFSPHPDHPRLLPVSAFPRWDRVGYRATQVYQEMVNWIQGQQAQLEAHLVPGPVSILDRAIQQFLWKGNSLPGDQLTALRELIAIAGHYWQVNDRLRSYDRSQTESRSESVSSAETVGAFIQLLRRGTITANPYPLLPAGQGRKGVTLGTIFQYRFSRRAHPWHLWLDAGSDLWRISGEATRFGSPLFLCERLGQPWTEDDSNLADQERLRRILLDLLSRCSRLFLCHSSLAASGQEQTGPLLPLIHAAVPWAGTPSLV